jgi:hypothetical protein
VFSAALKNPTIRNSWFAVQIMSTTSRGSSNLTSSWADGLRQIEGAGEQVAH